MNDWFPWGFALWRGLGSMLLWCCRRLVHQTHVTDRLYIAPVWVTNYKINADILHYTNAAWGRWLASVYASFCFAEDQETSFENMPELHCRRVKILWGDCNECLSICKLSLLLVTCIDNLHGDECCVVLGTRLQYIHHVLLNRLGWISPKICPVYSTSRSITDTSNKVTFPMYT